MGFDLAVFSCQAFARFVTRSMPRWSLLASLKRFVTLESGRDPDRRLGDNRLESNDHQNFHPTVKGPISLTFGNRNK